MQHDQPLIDSEMIKEEALAQNPAFVAPQEIIDSLDMIDVLYYSFDQNLHQGQVVIHKELIKDLQEIFTLLREDRFPIQSFIPIADKRFQWNDESSMHVDNSSGYNYRFIADTKRLSDHALGRAIDINPLRNPYIKNHIVRPKGAVYDISKPGTINSGSHIVSYFKERGWDWGGEWVERKDYQHFSKAA
jgi:peptidoglycan LD-endopeptidase CwlK